LLPIVHTIERNQRIEVLMMIGYGDRARIHQEVCQRFREKYSDQPINQSTISRIENKFREHGVVKNLLKTGRRATLNEDA
jgi:hypothetical protein